MRAEKKIFYILGKSASGKDSIFGSLVENKGLGLKKIVPYTTRPIREGERQGQDYFYCDEEKVRRLSEENRIIELREYRTVYGPWKYFTAFDDQFQVDETVKGFLMIGTLEGYLNVSRYFGKNVVMPIYVEVEDGERLMRAIVRERKQEKPGYAEVCRRFLADSEDFSEEKLSQANINKRFENHSLEKTVKEITAYIRYQLEDCGEGNG